MQTPPVLWLASYPRSGNTFLRTILHHAFGLRSGSVYPGDLGGNAALEAYVGHIEHGADGRIWFPDGALPLVKTHRLPSDDAPTIYVVRDGRPACLSLWTFYGRIIPLEAVIAGQHRFGTWADHLRAWAPWQRPRTLFLRYEDLTGDLTGVLARLGAFLDRTPIAHQIPQRETIAGVDGRWVTQRHDWRKSYTADQLRLFDAVNGAMMRHLGYGDDGP